MFVKQAFALGFYEENIQSYTPKTAYESPGPGKRTKCEPGFKNAYVPEAQKTGKNGYSITKRAKINLG